MDRNELPVPPLPGAAQVVAPAEEQHSEDRSPYILVARYRKAKKVAQGLLRLGADAEQTQKLGETEVGRKLAAESVGANVPSEVTWALVVELVREVRP